MTTVTAPAAQQTRYVKAGDRQYQEKTITIVPLADDQAAVYECADIGEPSWCVFTGPAGKGHGYMQARHDEFLRRGYVILRPLG